MIKISYSFENSKYKIDYLIHIYGKLSNIRNILRTPSIFLICRGMALMRAFGNEEKYQKVGSTYSGKILIFNPLLCVNV